MSKFEDKAKIWHRFYKGKLSIVPKVPITSLEDIAVWYTPGVAYPCREIQRNPEKLFEYTGVGNLVAIITDGSRILGLGNIGRAGLPVMEGKSLLYKYFGDVDAFPICLSTQDPDEIIQTIKMIAPSFGGINLEDIETPKSFYIFKQLTKQLDMPVFYDDYQGTAIVVLASMLNSLKIVGKKLSELRLTVVGAGAAAMGSTRLLLEAGVKAGNILMVDSKGIIFDGREDLNNYKSEIAKITNMFGVRGNVSDALKGADAVIALSSSGPGIITGDMVTSMADNAIVFALANPIPEILPDEAKSAGAEIVATGRSDFPNQVNNSIGFPALFRGILDVRARGINKEMLLAAANEIAKIAEEQGIKKDHILPTMMDSNLYPRVAAAVGEAAVKTGFARIKISYGEIKESAEYRISRSQQSMRLLAEKGFIYPPPATS